MKTYPLGFLIMMAVLGTGSAAFGAFGDFTLEDDNARIEMSAVTAGQGVYQWFVDGHNHLGKQWFWYRTDAMDHEVSIDEIPNFVSISSDPNRDGLFEQRSLTYYIPDLFDITVSLLLDGKVSGSGRASLDESIEICNASSETLVMTFFQLCDFNLTGSEVDWIAQISGNRAEQSDVHGNVVELVNSPDPDRWEVGLAPTLLDALNDDVVTDLSNKSGPCYDGDLAWAFQWEIELDPGESFTIDKSKSITILPEPSSLVLLAVGALLLRRA